LSDAIDGSSLAHPLFSAPFDLLSGRRDLFRCFSAHLLFISLRIPWVLPEHTEELTMPPKNRLWLNKVERLFPGPNHSGQEYQEKPVRLFVHRSFDLSMKDSELLS
jgi:hypothetical protein